MHIAVAAARGKYLVFLDPLLTPRQGWLDELVAYSESYPEVAVIGSKILRGDNLAHHSGMALDAKREPQSIYRGFPAEHPAVSRSRRFPVVSGECLFIARATYLASGGFDLRYTSHYWDADLCLRLGSLGREIHLCHDSVLTCSDRLAISDVQDSNHDQATYLRRWAKKATPSDALFFLEDGLLQLHYDRIGTVECSIAQIVQSPIIRKGALRDRMRSSGGMHRFTA